MRIKKMLSIIISTALVLTTLALPITAKAEATTWTGYTTAYEFTENDTKVIISGTGAMPEFMSSNQPWTVLGKKDTITTVIIEDGVTTVGRSSFQGCSKLSSVTIPNTVTNISVQAFGKCASLSEITLPSTVTDIGNYSFWNCTSLKSIEIPDSVTSIGSGVFSGCTSLETVLIPESVTSLDATAFTNCPNAVIYYSGNSETVISALKSSNAKEVVTSSVVENTENESGAAFAEDMGDGGATGFVTNLLANKVVGDNDAISKITWTVTTSDNESKKFIKEFDTPLSLKGAENYITFIIKGLYDKSASVMMRIN